MDKRSLVIDPHDGHSLGIPVPKARADYVVTTHDHFDHSATRVVEKSQGTTEVHRTPSGDQAMGPFEVRGVAAFHDQEAGAQRGSIRMVRVKAGGVRLAHLGDLGHALDSETAKALGSVDVLFVPAGEVFTLSVADAWKTVERLNPRVVVPMHYNVPGLSLPLREVDAFLEGHGEPVRMGSSLELEEDDLPPSQEIWVFST